MTSIVCIYSIGITLLLYLLQRTEFSNKSTGGCALLIVELSDSIHLIDDASYNRNLCNCKTSHLRPLVKVNSISDGCIVVNRCATQMSMKLSQLLFLSQKK